jgi:hypothetical protein
MALERNWVGPLAANDGIDVTWSQFREMEKSAPPQRLQNWRFQQALYRAYYDAYIHHRLLYEMALEKQARDQLRLAARLGSLVAIDAAQSILARGVTQPIHCDWRTRIFQLAEALFQSVHMQLSVPLYYAQSETRGANLDGLDFPLNDRPWLDDQMACIRTFIDEGERLAAIETLLSWEDPGPGGYYLNLSNATGSPYVRLELCRGPRVLPFSPPPVSILEESEAYSQGLARLYGHFK